MATFNFPESLPPFPPSAEPWGANVVTGRQVLDDAYVRALQALHQEDSDTLRYKLLSSNIIDNLLPVLEGLEREVPRDWVDECANIFGPLVYELQVAALAAEGVCVFLHLC
jgi:hypothetical protein